jgi:serine/threonine-protein kinase
MTHPAVHEELQTVLGERYELGRELGRGGMATVYLARDTRADRQVAVKVLHPDLGMALGPERFRREIDIVARLSHPNILTIEDFGGAGGALFYVMPYLTGETLAARMRREGMLPVEEAVRITCQVARALDYAHRQGIVHRDVKPDNILFENGQALLADFGIARAINESGAEQRLTQTGLMLGTPVYMSPEQAVAERAIDGRSDVYSLGCVLYEMLAGHPPFTGPTAQAVIARQMLDDVPSITVVRGAVPDEVEDAVLRALSKAAVDRFPTALAFAEALEHSVATGGRTLGSGDRRSRSRRRVTAAVLAAQRRRRGRGLLIAGVVLAVAGAGVSAWRLAVGRRADAAARQGEADVLAAKRVAVTYFDDLSPDHALAPVADGLTEELIARLSAVQGLDVVSRNGVAAFRDPAIAPDSVARALGAGTVLRGTVEQAGRGLRVTVRLIDGASGADLRRASFTQATGSPLAVRDTLVGEVARFLRERVGDEVRLRQSRQGTTNVAAWTALQRSNRALEDARDLARRNDTAGVAAAERRADSLAAVAAALDPAWADAAVQRGTVALRAARGTADAVAAARRVTDGLAHANAALARDGENAAALELRGALRYERWARHLEPDPRAAAALLPAAEADLRRAVAREPSRAAAWNTLALIAYQKPDLTGAAFATQRAYEADAYLENADAILWRLYTTAYDGESFTDASHWCDEGRARFPQDPRFVRCQLWLFTTSARPADPAAAWRLVDTLRARTPAKQWAYLGREASMLAAAAVGRAGLKDSAGRVLERARSGPDVDPDRELLTVEAFLRDLLGERDEALDLLQQYLVAHPEHRSGFASPRGSWWWRGLRSDPRFRQLVGAGP